MLQFICNFLWPIAGNPGQPGREGPPGPQGHPGPKGIKGDDGETGSIGLQGNDCPKCCQIKIIHIFFKTLITGGLKFKHVDHQARKLIVIYTIRIVVCTL